jgi:hypothetical protein
VSRIALVVLAVAMGCALPVKVGEIADTTGASLDTSSSSSSSGPPDVSSSSETGDPPLPDRHDYAIRFADLPDIDPTGMSTTAGSGDGGTSGGPPFDPDSLVVTATLGFDTCDDPYGSLPCGDRWSVSFNLPPELQIVGATGRLEDHNGFVAETGPLGQPGDECSGGGGSLLGTFEITAIDADHVAGKLRELELAPFGTQLDFDAPRC